MRDKVLAAIAEATGACRRVLEGAGGKVLTQTAGSGETSDLAAMTQAGENIVIRCVTRPGPADYADLGMMVSEGDFSRAFIVYTEEGETNLDGPVPTIFLARIDDLVSHIVSTETCLHMADQRSKWTRLFKDETPRLVRSLRSFRDRVSPEDLIQTAFAKVLEQDMDAIDDPRAYLTRLVHNLAVDEIRRQNRARVSSFSNDELEAALSDGSSPFERSDLSPEELLIARERLAHMLAMLRNLPERERLALLLHKHSGFTHQEIGERLGVSPHSVPRYLSRAVAKCAKALADFETGKRT